MGKPCKKCRGVGGHNLDIRCLTPFAAAKLAAIVRHFGASASTEEDAYLLEIPLREVLAVDPQTRVLPADDPNWSGLKPGPTVAYVSYKEKGSRRKLKEEKRGRLHRAEV